MLGAFREKGLHSVWRNTELHKHRGERGRKDCSQMTTTVAGVYRFEWYALAPACFAVQGGQSVRGSRDENGTKGGLASQPGTSFMISFSRARAACSLR